MPDNTDDFMTGNKLLFMHLVKMEGWNLLGVLTRCEIANDNTDDSMTVDIESVGVTDKVQTDDNILDQDTDTPSTHTDVIEKGMESVGVKTKVYTDNTRVTDKIYTDDTPDHNDDSTVYPSYHTDVNNEVMESVQNADQKQRVPLSQLSMRPAKI